MPRLLRGVRPACVAFTAKSCCYMEHRILDSNGQARQVCTGGVGTSHSSTGCRHDDWHWKSVTRSLAVWMTQAHQPPAPVWHGLAAGATAALASRVFTREQLLLGPALDLSTQSRPCMCRHRRSSQLAAPRRSCRHRQSAASDARSSRRRERYIRQHRRHLQSSAHHHACSTWTSSAGWRKV